MGKSLVPSLALLAGAACAQAQPAPPSGVQLYGVVDTGVEFINNIGAGKSHLARMPSLSGGQLPSRWGVRGSEELGGGLRTVFTLEAGFGVDNGVPQQGGRGFGRQAYVGFAGPWGTLTAGRQWTMTYFSMLDADVIGPAVFGTATLDPYLPQARVDNSVSYLGSFGGLKLGATYSLGRDVQPPANCGGENPSHDCRAWSVMLKYDAERWGAALSYDKLHGGTAGTFFGQPPGTVATSSNTDTRKQVNGYWRLGAAKVGGGIVWRNLRVQPTPLSTRLVYLGASVPVAGALSVDAQVLRLHDDRPDSDARALVVRGNYALSRRTSVYLLLGHMSNEANVAYSVTAGEFTSVAPLPGQGQSGVMMGVRHVF
jgi:predicted porin